MILLKQNEILKLFFNKAYIPKIYFYNMAQKIIYFVYSTCFVGSLQKYDLINIGFLTKYINLLNH